MIIKCLMVLQMSDKRAEEDKYMETKRLNQEKTCAISDLLNMRAMTFGFSHSMGLGALYSSALDQGNMELFVQRPVSR